METKTTHIDQVRQRMASISQRVRGLLGWNREEYYDFLLDAGHQYLVAYLGGDEFIIKQLEGTRVFWNWWRLHWSERERNWLVYADMISPEDRSLRYQLIHEPKALAQEMEINGRVLRESYAIMIKEAVKTPA